MPPINLVSEHLYEREREFGNGLLGTALLSKLALDWVDFLRGLVYSK